MIWPLNGRFDLAFSLVGGDVVYRIMCVEPTN